MAYSKNNDSRRPGGDRGGDRGGNKFGGRDTGGFSRPNFAKKSFGGGDRGEQSGGGDREMFRATCANCGKSCEVPFRPAPGKSVYCKECFANKPAGAFDKPSYGGQSGPKTFNTHSSPIRTYSDAPAAPRGNDDVKKQLEMTNAKLDRLIQAIDNLAVKLVPQKEAVIVMVPEDVVPQVALEKEATLGELVKKSTKKAAKESKKKK